MSPKGKDPARDKEGSLWVCKVSGKKKKAHPSMEIEKTLIKRLFTNTWLG